MEAPLRRLTRQQKALTRLERLRRRTDHLLKHVVVELALLVLILLSVVLVVLEVVVAGPAVSWVVFLGDVLTGVFAVELTLRFWVARSKVRYFERYWIDILAVFPMVRALRFLRVFRVMRLFRAGVLMHRRLGGEGGAKTGGEMLGLAVASVTLVLLCALVLFSVEGGEEAAFPDFDHAMWFAAYSLIGGEPIGGTPVTEVGRWTTLILMIGGLTLFGVFVGTVSAGMVDRLSRRMEIHELDIDELVDHVVVCGWNKSGPTVLRELFGPDMPLDRAVVLVTEQEEAPSDVPVDGVRAAWMYHYHGDYTRVNVLKAVGIHRAESVILLADELIPRAAQDCDARTVLAALTIERLVPEIYTVAELHSRENEELLKMAGVEEIVVGDFYAGMIIGSVQRNRGLVQVLDEILTGTHGNAFVTVRVPEAWAGRTIRELHQVLFSDHAATLVSVERGGVPVVNPGPELVVQGGESMVVLAKCAFALGKV